MTPEEFYYEYKVMGRKGDLTEEECIEMLTKYSQQKQDYIETLEETLKRYTLARNYREEMLAEKRTRIIDLQELLHKAWLGMVWEKENQPDTFDDDEFLNEVEESLKDTRCHE